MPKEEALRRLRYESYFWNNVLTAAKSEEKKKSTVKPPISPSRTEPTWMNSTIEEATELLDLSKLINSDRAGSYLPVLIAAFARYDEAGVASDEATEATDNPLTHIQSLLLSASSIITAPLMNDISHSRKNMKRRERRLRTPIYSGVREALQELSKREQVLRTAQSVEEVEQVRKAQRASGPTLKAFENTNVRRKNLRNQRLNTVRAWNKVGAAERLFVKTHVLDMERVGAELESPQDADVSKDENIEMGSEGTDMEGEDAGQDIEMVEVVSQVDGWCVDCECHHIPRAISGKAAFAHVKKCPRQSLGRTIQPIMLTSIAGTGFRSRIGVHVRRGGGKMRKEHQRHCIVAMTDEYRSSKTWVFCFSPVQLARGHRIVNGLIRTARDTHSAMAIAIAGALNLLSSDHQTLPPSRKFNHIPPLPSITANTINANNTNPVPDNNMPLTSIIDATGALSEVEGL
ncbi:hypothetical protein BGZ98_009564 [Dissophora globulifera]|nr:hypothetical protein BGZ98_009564 [Dissophora globulifera]